MGSSNSCLEIYHNPNNFFYSGAFTCCSFRYYMIDIFQSFCNISINPKNKCRQLVTVFRRDPLLIHFIGYIFIFHIPPPSSLSPSPSPSPSPSFSPSSHFSSLYKSANFVEKFHRLGKLSFLRQIFTSRRFCLTCDQFYTATNCRSAQLSLSR